MTLISGMWFHTFSTTVFKTVVNNVLNAYFTTVFKTVVKNVLNTYFTTVFKTVVKNVLDRQTLYFTVANCLRSQKQYTFSKNSNETRRI